MERKARAAGLAAHGVAADRLQLKKDALSTRHPETG